MSKVPKSIRYFWSIKYVSISSLILGFVQSSPIATSRANILVLHVFLSHLLLLLIVSISIKILISC